MAFAIRWDLLVRPDALILFRQKAGAPNID